MNALSQLLKFNPFKGASWENLGGALNGLIGRTLYYVIICGIGRVADICQLVFRKFAGISSTGVKVNGEATTGDVALVFLQSDIVKNLFWALIILAIVLLLVTTFIAVIRTEFAKDGNNNKKKVIKHAFRGLVNFLIVPVVSVLAVIVGNFVLRAVDGAISTGKNQYISSQIFIAGAYNANRARNSEKGDENGGYNSGSYGALLAGTSGDDANGYGNFGIFLDDKSGTNRLRAADKIDNCFSSGYAYKVGSGLITGTTYTNNRNVEIINDSAIKIGDVTTNSKTIDYSKTDFWYDGMLLGSLNVEYVNTEGGDDKVNVKNSGGGKTFQDGEIVNFSYYNVGLVYYYYDLSLTGFNYLIGGIAMVFTAWTLLLTVLGLIKRIFMITTLFVISAPVCAIYPLDEGKALERWRTEFIKEVLAAYSVVVVMNLFLSLLPIFSDMSIFVSGELGGLTEFANYFGRVLVILGGLTFFKGAAKTVATIIGAGDALGDSDNAKGAFKANVGRVAGVGAALGALGIGAAKGAKNLKDKASNKLDERYAKKHGADALAQDAAMGEDGGKAENPSDPIGGSGHSMNSAPSSGGPVGGGSGGSSSGGHGGGSSIPLNPDGTPDWHKARKAHYDPQTYTNLGRNLRDLDKGFAGYKLSSTKEKLKAFKGKDTENLKGIEKLRYNHLNKNLKKYDMKANNYDQYRQDKKYKNYDKRHQAWANTKSVAKGVYGNVVQPIAGPLTSIVKNALKGDWKVKDAAQSYKGTAGYQDKQKKAAEKAKAQAQEKRMNEMAKSIKEIEKNTKK